MKILVTGGSGRIGFRTMQLLQKSGHKIVNLDIVPPKTTIGEFIEGRLTDRNLIDKATKDIDAILHLAAYPTEAAIPNYPEGWDVNCTGTFNIFEYAAKNRVKKVVYASSICATGLITWVSSNHGIQYLPVDEDHPCRPHNLYGLSKVLAEEIARMHAARSETSYIGLRFATVWFDAPGGGPDDYTKMLIDKFVRDPEALIKRPSEFATMFAPMTADALKDLCWQYVGVWDVAEACKLALEKEDIKYGVYNIGGADTCSEFDSIKIAQMFYPGVPLRNPVVFLADKKAPLYDISKAQKELGFAPKLNWKDYVK
jgi:nucleoside-diphosphate-sugar epimerase